MPHRTKHRAKHLRQIMTPAEQTMWQHLRARRLGGYVVDFACYRAKLAIEIDGDSHTLEEQADFDRRRTAYLNSYDWAVIRFWNVDVFENSSVVCDAILKCVEERVVLLSPSPPILRMGPSSPSRER